MVPKLTVYLIQVALRLKSSRTTLSDVAAASHVRQPSKWFAADLN